MTFLEAVQALKDGKCKAIARKCEDAGCRSFRFINNGHGNVVNGHGSSVATFHGLLATDWQLIDPVPEKRTVKGWVNFFSSYNDQRPFQCSRVYGSKEEAMNYRDEKEYFGPPFYIEHTYEVTE